jgi:hypothetical protein
VNRASGFSHSENLISVRLSMVYLFLCLLPSERKLAERRETRLFLIEIKGRGDVLPLPLPLAYNLLSKLSSNLSKPF